MQQQPNMLIAFLQELLQRFFTKSPKFFRIWQTITAIAAAITGIPEACAYFGITLPDSVTILQNKFIAAVSTGMFIMSALTTQSKTTGDSVNGQPLKITDAKSLPFTSAQEIKKTEENKPL
jgi:MFS superfamily sulfate permease-like transporter